MKRKKAMSILNKLCASMEWCSECEIWKITKEAKLGLPCRDILDEYPDEVQVILEKWRVDHDV